MSRHHCRPFSAEVVCYDVKFGKVFVEALLETTTTVQFRFDGLLAVSEDRVGLDTIALRAQIAQLSSEVVSLKSGYELTRLVALAVCSLSAPPLGRPRRVQPG